MKTLAIVFSEPLALYVLPTDVTGSVRLGGREFTDSGSGDWIGFYDWLRTSDGELLGVRTWLNIDDVGVRQELAQHSSVEVVDAEIRVWFSGNRRYDESRSDDQDLGTHRLIRAESNEFAFTFDLDQLDEGERAVLRTFATASDDVA